MKNLFLIVGCACLVVLSMSCARDCKCTYFEDGKKVAIYSTSEEYGAKFYDKAECELESEAEHKTTVCKVNCEKEAGPRPDFNDFEAWQAWQDKVDACYKQNRKEVKAKMECKLQ